MDKERPQNSGGTGLPPAGPSAASDKPAVAPAVTPGNAPAAPVPQPRARVFHVQQTQQTKKPVVQVQQDTKTPGSASGRIAATMTPGHSRPAAPPTGGRVAAPAGQPPRPPAQVAPGPIDHTATTPAPRRAPPPANAHQEQPQLEEFVQKLLRPLINAWLDGHMPVYIAEALRREQAARQRKAGT